LDTYNTNPTFHFIPTNAIMPPKKSKHPGGGGMACKKPLVINKTKKAIPAVTIRLADWMVAASSLEKFLQSSPLTHS